MITPAPEPRAEIDHLLRELDDHWRAAAAHAAIARLLTRRIRQLQEARTG